MTIATLIALVVLAMLAATGRASRYPQGRQLRALVYGVHPCIAAIVDLEDRSWDPTVDFGGGHGNVYESYGLPQANPGTKMASAGADWRTNPWTQVRWAVGYAVGRYGSECGALAFRRAHGWW